MEAVFFRQPSGTNGSLPLGAFTRSGNTFTATLTVPANALSGVWRIAELGVRNAVNETYRFLAADLFSGVMPCPSFQNIGVFACASTLVETNGLLTVIAGTPAPPPPVLSGLVISPSTLQPGESATLSVTVTDAAAMEAVFFRQPSGTNGSLPLGAFTRSGNTFTATLTVPANALSGVWRIAELGVRNAVNETYRFLAADLFSGVMPCPSFQNIGVFACASTLVQTNGLLTVIAGTPAPPPPVLSGLVISPSTLQPGESATLSVTVTDAAAMEAVFFRQPSGTNGSLPLGAFTRSGDTFTATLTVPANALSGVWRIAELGVRNAVNETYRFLAADLFSGIMPCPSFQNIGVFACASTLVENAGSLSVALVTTRVLSLSGNLAFGSVAVGSTATSILRITNNGNAPLTIGSISYPSGFSGDWPSGTVTAGQSQIVNVTFAPTTATGYSGAITVSGDQTSGMNTIAASGTGTAVPTRIMALSGTLAFGNLTQGTMSTRPLTISNTGNSALTVTAISYPTGFGGDWAGGTIAAGESQLLNVTFAPTTATSYSGTVTVSGDQTTGTNTIAASGTGTPVPTRIIALSGTLTFGNVMVGTMSTRPLTISNTGNSALTVTAISYPGGFGGDWAGGTIAAGQSQILNVTFAPTTATSYSGAVTVSGNQTSGATTIAASGTGTTQTWKDLVGNFGPSFGIWGQRQTGWINVHLWSPKTIVSGDFDGNGLDDLAINFSPNAGVWLWMNHATWVWLHDSSPTTMAVADLDHSGRSDLVLSFPGAGVWAWMNHTEWRGLHPFDAVRLAVGDLDGGGNDDLVVDFPGYGLWALRNNTTWDFVHPYSVTTMATADLDANGKAELVASFQGYGIWVYSNSTDWTFLHPSAAKAIAAGQLDGGTQTDLVVDFGPSFGIWTLSNSAVWSQVHYLSSTAIALADFDGDGRDEIAIGFDALGVWRYTVTAASPWTFVHSAAVSALVASGIH